MGKAKEIYWQPTKSSAIKLKERLKKKYPRSKVVMVKSQGKYKTKMIGKTYTGHMWIVRRY